MSLRVCVLASGSAGNALLVRGPAGTLLVDAGLTLKELGRRLAQADCDPGELVGVLVTHEHGDHAGGAGVLARRLGLPIWLSRGTARAAARQWRGGERLEFVADGARFHAAGIDIEAWSCSHDAAEPLQFGFRAGEASLAVCTDLGHATPRVEECLRGRHMLVLEANHDRERLLAGPYPWYLKRRILGERGHLSNGQSAQLLARVAGADLKGVVLGHLSKENNLPGLALDAAGEALTSRGRADLSLFVAEQDKAGLWLDVFSGRTC
jgi:phosphoribosyl 1,2-cyclic phosphodiesterase